MDRQVVASGRKLNLRTDLLWVARQTRKFPRKCMQLAEKRQFKADFTIFRGLMIG